MDALQNRVERAQQRLMAIEKKQAQAKAALRDATAAKRSQERKLDTRRKVLLGALLQHEMSTGAESERAILNRLERFLTRAADRALFDLPERIDTKHTTGTGEGT